MTQSVFSSSLITLDQQLSNLDGRNEKDGLVAYRNLFSVLLPHSYKVRLHTISHDSYRTGIFYLGKIESYHISKTFEKGLCEINSERGTMRASKF